MNALHLSVSSVCVLFVLAALAPAAHGEEEIFIKPYHAESYLKQACKGLEIDLAAEQMYYLALEEKSADPTQQEDPLPDQPVPPPPSRTPFTLYAQRVTFDTQGFKKSIALQGAPLTSVPVHTDNILLELNHRLLFVENSTVVEKRQDRYQLVVYRWPEMTLQYASQYENVTAASKMFMSMDLELLMNDAVTIMTRTRQSQPEKRAFMTFTGDSDRYYEQLDTVCGRDYPVCTSEKCKYLMQRLNIVLCKRAHSKIGLRIIYGYVHVGDELQYYECNNCTTEFAFSRQYDLLLIPSNGPDARYIHVTYVAPMAWLHKGCRFPLSKFEKVKDAHMFADHFYVLTSRREPTGCYIRIYVLDVEKLTLSRDEHREKGMTDDQICPVERNFVTDSIDHFFGEDCYLEENDVIKASVILNGSNTDHPANLDKIQYILSERAIIGNFTDRGVYMKKFDFRIVAAQDLVRQDGIDASNLLLCTGEGLYEYYYEPLPQVQPDGQRDPDGEGDAQSDGEGNEDRDGTIDIDIDDPNSTDSDKGNELSKTAKLAIIIIFSLIAPLMVFLVVYLVRQYCSHQRKERELMLLNGQGDSNVRKIPLMPTGSVCVSIDSELYEFAITKQQFRDQYKKIGQLGAGAFGTVYEYEHTTTHTRVAVKIVCTENSGQQSDVMREIRMMCRLKNVAGVVKLIQFVHHIDVDSVTSQFMIIMEKAEQTLEEYINKVKQGDQAHINETFMRRLIFETVHTLAHLQKLDIAHRDIKPSNILMFKDANGQYVFKLSDFGCTKLQTLDNYNGALTILGTPKYISPQLWQRMNDAIDKHTVRDQENWDMFKSDVFSLGLSLLECATRQDVSELNQQQKALARAISDLVSEDAYSEQVMSIILRSLIWDEKKRPDFNMLKEYTEKEHFGRAVPNSPKQGTASGYVINGSYHE